MNERPYTGFYVRFLGKFAIYYQGEELPVSANPQTKSMQILFMLLKAGKKGVERKTFIEFLQGEDGDWERGMNNFRQRAFLLRKIISRSRFPAGSYIKYRNERYYFSLEYDWESDTDQLDQIVRELKSGRQNADEIRELEQQYCDLYQGEFLPMLGGEAWVAQEAAYYQKWYFKCVNDLSRHLKDTGQYERLLEICTAASRMHPYDEWQTVQVDCLMAMHRYQEALKVYEQASELFYEELGVSSLDQTVARYRSREGQLFFLANAMTGIKEALAEEEVQPGAYQCSYPSFVDAYRMLARMESRSGIPSVVMICTMEGPHGCGRDGSHRQEEDGGSEASQPEMLEKKMEQFRQILAAEIRSGDVYTRYSSRQFLALMINAEEQDGEKIADRLSKKWAEIGEDHEWTMEFLIQRTEGPGKEECRNGKEGDIRDTYHRPGERYLAGADYLA